MTLSALALILTSVPAAEPEARWCDVRRGQVVTIDQVADELAGRDVVFLGEEHDNPAGHRQYAALIEAVHQRRQDVALSLEMFERDVQGAMDDYLRGRIDEGEFLRVARPWKNYAADYRPCIEFAKAQRLDVIAANAPRRSAKAVSEGKETVPEDAPFLPRETTAPFDAYRRRFVEVMKGHAGADKPNAIERFYAAQCLKDDAMAEAVTDYIAKNGHRRPLVIHRCGRFHSDFGGGTALRVLTRRPLLSTCVVSMEPADDPARVDAKDHRDRCHFLLVVPKPMKSDAK